MRWSWKLGTIAGIGLYVHSTFVLILAWVAYIFYVQDGQLLSALVGIVFTLALFACVVLHEFGHALTARRFGYQTRDITLLPIGGVARLERMPEDPAQEFAVAIAGPLVNVAIAGVLAVLLLAAGIPFGPSTLIITQGNFVGQLMWVNLWLAVFNMVPAFPMDGGRVLRALLARRMPFTQATLVASSVGQGLAFVFGFLGLLINPFLILIAVFVYMAASEEAAVVQMRSVFTGISVDHAMLTHFHTLQVHDTLRRAVELLLSGSQHDFPVMDGNRQVGVLTRDALMRALRERGEDSWVGEAMQPGIEAIPLMTPLSIAVQRLQGMNAPLLVVEDEGRNPVGILTRDRIGEYVMIHSALGADHWKQSPALPRSTEQVV